MTDPIELAAVVTTDAGRVLGFTDADAARAWILENKGWTIWTAASYWRRERAQRLREEGADPPPLS